jgi:DNA polymerase III delta prime subunit
VPFRDVTGHRRVVELLSRSIARAALPPSLIFAGPAGRGKRLTAVAVAQALNCLKPITTPDSRLPTDACGTCVPCRRIARGVHPDVVIVEPGDSGSIKIDPIRDVIDRASYRPFEGKRRAVIVDAADALVVPAQNALLKTLEEPTPSSVFMLLTSRPDMLLVTVRSRCIRLAFTDASLLDVDEGARAVAQRVLAQAASAGDGARLDGARDLLSSTGSSAASDREQVTTHLKAMASLLRDIAIITTRADAPLANPDLKGSLERLAPAYGGERGVRAFAAIDRAIAAITANTGIKVVADWLVLQL